MKFFGLHGHQFEALLGSEFGQKPTLAFLILDFVLPEAFLHIGQTMFERPVIEQGDLSPDRLGRHQAPFGLFETPEESAQSFVDRSSQTACPEAKEAASPIALALNSALAFAALSRARTQAQPTGEVLLGFPRGHIRAGLGDQLHQEAVGNACHGSHIPSTTDPFVGGGR